jgi:hypothetical protein
MPTAKTYSETDIELLTERGTKFLSTTSQVPNIRALLHEGGYSEAEHRHGWELLLDVLGYRTNTAQGSVQELRQRSAMAELDQWDGPAFDRSRAALERRYPDQAAYVFQNLNAKTGAESIGAVATFLNRVASLRDGTDAARASTRAPDKEAADLLAARKIVDATEEQRLRALIDQATSIADMPAPVEDPNVRQQRAAELDAWLSDWRESARVLVTRRDHQIRLGLAERRASKAGDASEA